MAEAAKHNFTPRQASKKDTLAVVLEDEAAVTYTAYVATLLKELVHLCAEKDFRLDVIPATECRLIRGKYVMGALGLVWKPESVKAFERISSTSLVAINAATEVPAVCADEAQGMEQATSYLMERGHRRIALIARDFEAFGDQHRRVVFKALAETKSGQSFDGSEILFDGGAESLLASLARVFKRPEERRPTALFATSENTGIQLMHCLDLLQIKVPEEVSVISHEAPAQSEFLIPPHTTLAQDYRAIVRKALELLQQESSKRPARTLIPFQLIERESVSRL